MNDIITAFKGYLETEKKVSKITSKNYTADLNKFLRWFSVSYNRPFDTLDFSSTLLDSYYKHTSSGSVRSQERYMSTLRKFASFLKEKQFINTNPFDIIKEDHKVTEDIDPWKLRAFKDFLYVNNSKRATIKNYVVDINAFTTWLSKATTNQSIDGIGLVNADIINLYKDRLVSVLGLSPKSVNRKLSSIRKYLEFSKSFGAPDISIPNINLLPESPQVEQVNKSNLRLEDFTLAGNTPEDETTALSPIPPIRLVQRLAAPYVMLEDKAATSIAEVIHRKGIENKAKEIYEQKPESVKNISKLLYAPREVFPASLTRTQRLAYHLKYTRPLWYKRYHTYPISSYLHLSILIIYASIVGYIIYNGLFADSKNEALAAASPPRILSFQGRLTDENDNPITEPTLVRFQIYNDESSTGSGVLLWQELNLVTPDESGIFNQLLGNGTSCLGQPLRSQSSSCLIQSSVFSDNSRLYLGITIENTDELSPRQQIASVAFASNSETLQGMKPITDTSSGQRNAILALDSSGNLSIGGTANPTFSATGGQFKLSGRPLLLTTNTGSNGNVVIEPDGLGGVDIRKGIVNSSNNGSIVPGAVEVHDAFAIIATESARAAFTVNNNTSGGHIFVASSSGTARFIIENGGDLSLQPGASIDAMSTGTILIGNSTATTITIGRSGQGITLPGFTGQNGILYGTNGTGVLAQATTSTANLCLISGTSAPAWASCSTGTAGAYWGQSSGILYPVNSTVDFSIGGQSTASAKFGIFNVNGSGPATATISGNLIVMNRNGSGGKLGVGTADPQLEAHINSQSDGNIFRLQDSDGTCDHNPEAGSETVTCSSDERLKSNISDAEETLPDLLKYRIRSYTVNASGDLMTGVIAQEVQQNFPDKVKVGQNGLLMVEQPSVWKLIKGIQELYVRIEKLTADLGNITLETMKLGEESTESVAESLKEYISLLVEETLSGARSISPTERIETISVNTLSPLATDSNISINLNNSKFEVRNSQDASSSAVVASIDNAGNATFSGVLTASSVSSSDSSFQSSQIGELTTQNVSVSGTLHADRIVANNIEGLDEKIAYATQTMSASSASGVFDFEEIINSRGSIAVGKFVDIETISSDFATFREGLVALGPATFDQITSLNSISVGTNFILSNNSINTLGMDLEIQPLRQGAVSFLAGAVRIEIDGTLRIRGNAEIAGDLTVGGKVKTNVISPLPGRDFIVEGSGSAVLSVNTTGDVTSSGSATFNKFNLSFVGPAYALSDTEVVSTSSAGLASIRPYKNELTVYNPNITDKSLIYITPVSRTYNQVLYLIRQTPGESFTVGIDAPVSREVQFNWIIVN